MAAEDDCVRKGGHLASVNSEQEQTDIGEYLNTKDTGYFWIWMGLTDLTKEGKWRWINGASLSYSNWLPRQPNQWGDQDCAYLSHKNFKWGDTECDEELFYLCEVY